MKRDFKRQSGDGQKGTLKEEKGFGMECEFAINEIDWDIVSQRFPEISFLLSMQKIEPLDLVRDQKGYIHATSLRGDLYSKDVEKEIASWKSRILWDGIDILYVYGVGLGSHYVAIKEWLCQKKERVCIFLEDDLSVLYTLFCLPVGRDILQNPQVHIYYAPNISSFDAVLEECAMRWMSDRIEFTAIFSYEKGRKKKLQSMRLKLLRSSTLIHIAISESLHYHLLMENILSNFFSIPHSFHANKWKGICKGIPAVICGAGVSLAQVSRFLQEFENRAIIIAGGSAITALGAMGICPHIAMALDPNDEEYMRIKASSLFEIPFIFSSRLNKEVLACSNMNLGYLCSDTGGPFESWMHDKLQLGGQSLGPELGAEALSVTTLAIPLARYLGCQKVLLCGVDLSYQDMQRYPPGVLPSAQVFFEELQAETRSMEKLVYRKNQEGKTVTSLVKWIMEASCIGSYVLSHPDMEFFTASKEGLPIKGVIPLAIDEFMHRHCQRTYDLRGLLHAESELARFSHIGETQVKEALQELKKSLEEALSLFDQMDKEISRKLVQDAHDPVESGVMSLLEMDLQNESAFSACLQNTFGAYQRILDRYFPCIHSVDTEQGRTNFLEKKKKLWQECGKVTKACLDLIVKALSVAF
jgi:hypothetical protein